MKQEYNFIKDLAVNNGFDTAYLMSKYLTLEQRLHEEAMVKDFNEGIHPRILGSYEGVQETALNIIQRYARLYGVNK